MPVCAASAGARLFFRGLHLKDLVTDWRNILRNKTHMAEIANPAMEHLRRHDLAGGLSTISSPLFRSSDTGPLRFQFRVLKTIRLPVPAEIESTRLAMLLRASQSASACACDSVRVLHRQLLDSFPAGRSDRHCRSPRCVHPSAPCSSTSGRDPPYPQPELGLTSEVSVASFSAEGPRLSFCRSMAA